jgi:hypothetical protein
MWTYRADGSLSELVTSVIDPTSVAPGSLGNPNDPTYLCRFGNTTTGSMSQDITFDLFRYTKAALSADRFAPIPAIAPSAETFPLPGPATPDTIAPSNLQLWLFDSRGGYSMRTNRGASPTPTNPPPGYGADYLLDSSGHGYYTTSSATSEWYGVDPTVGGYWTVPGQLATTTLDNSTIGQFNYISQFSSAWTIAGMLRFPSASIGAGETILSNIDGNNDGFSLGTAYSGTNRLWFSATNEQGTFASEVTSPNGNGQYSADTWYYFALDFNGNGGTGAQGLSAYLIPLTAAPVTLSDVSGNKSTDLTQGVLSGNTAAATMGSTAALTVAGGANSETLMSDLSIWNSALTDADILTLANAHLSKPSASLVGSVTPSNGATGVAIDSSITVRFNVPMNQATLNSSTLLLQDAASNSVPVAISYDPNMLTATLTPNGPLTNGETYIVTVKGGANGVSDQNGNTLASDFSSSFATVLPPIPLAPGPFSIWSNTTSPGVTDNPDSEAVELGVKFRAAGDGFISGIRYYKSANNTGTHVGNLWAADGTLLATATFTGESTSGWQTVFFAHPVAIKAGTTYIASYHTNTGNYADDIGFFSKGGVTNGPLTALANGVDGPNGVYHYGASSAFPATTYNSSNYWVDVVLTSLVGSVTPSNGATGVAIDSSITVRFNVPMNQATLNSSTLLLQDAASNSVPVAISYDPNMLTATLTPNGPLTNGETYTVVVKGGASGVLDTAGDSMAADFNSTFITAVSVPISIFGNSSVPTWIDNPDTQAVELGMKFRADVDGFITGILFYKSPNNTGTHVANLWSSNGTLLGSATFTNETASGWQTVLFAQPIPIQANTTYIASYHTNVGHYSDNIGYFTASGVTNGPLHALGDGVDGPDGVYNYGTASAFPTNTYHGSNYWVDVLFKTQVP